MYPCVDDAHLSGLITKGVLLVFSLQVIDTVDTLFVEDHEPFISRPAKANDLALVPLQQKVSTQTDMRGNGVSTLKSKIGSPAGE